ncbi:ATP-binding protein [Microbacterium halophytorum]|uniref:ATP-binding protein n=1 Tax=Microbacterium halophytorum TaxID=2067568 RepID=UPI000CFCDBC9|nr:ATP-binding protein [Microbacterium halophytorum]
MTMLDTLFGMIPAASRGQQWVADELQLVNWGGYDGAHRVRFSPRATLLVGGSGSGKSTLMDAYIALMMPHTTPFNGASNGGVTGRPRGEDQRNILSYGRGKIDESRTDSGTAMRVLRGDGADTWTAVAMTWTDHGGAQFTAVRAWYIPQAARTIDDTVRVRATIDGAFDLASLEEAAGARLADHAVRRTGLETLSTEREFSARIQSVLGIGAAGAGGKAISLLARIQAGQQITTVDDLYKRMVLSEPETLAAADAVVEHFDELDQTRSRMVTARKQIRQLAPIRGMRERIEEAADRLRLIDEIGLFSDDASLAALWRDEKRLGLLRDVEGELQRAKRDADDVVRAQEALADAAEAERDGLAEVLRGAGGDRLHTAERELREVERRLARARAERERFDVLAEPIGGAVGGAKAFAKLQAEAERSIADPDAKRTAREAYAEARAASRATEREIASLEAEARAALDRSDSIPQALHDSRDAMAAAAGLSRDDLPFVGELLEVRTEFEPWNEAIGLALGGFATTLLIDQRRLGEFRAAINGVRTPVRIRYEGAQADLGSARDLDPATLPGRLDYRESPFVGWLQERLERRFGFTCVDAPEELADTAMGLTIAGQMSNGNRGAHGGHGKQSVLGFSNRRRVAGLMRRIERARAELADQKLAESAAANDLDALDARLAAYGKIRDIAWPDIDVDAVAVERERWASVIGEVRDDNPKVEDIQRQIQRAKQKVASLQEDTGRGRAEQERIALRWAEVTDQVDEAQARIDAAEAAERTLTEAQRAYLDERFAPPEGAERPSRADELDRFDAALSTAGARLIGDQAAATATLGEQREALRRTLEGFLDAWPNPNLRADPEASFGDFERILAELETSGLHELEAEWKASLVSLSGNDLTSLDSALGRALREIRERIEPVNRIMAELPFYDDEHRLQITARENSSQVRRRFRRELREVRAAISSATDDAERELVYDRMSRLIGRIRRTSPDFADLIDVRGHVRISAEKIDAATREHVALYDHIGEKSGGESQELVAFIVGAALRYQLGDADSERPRYAPVFLDEALIKADAHFTKRAIGAWRGLGFQLVIGAPNDKYSAIEPHVDVEYDILKDTAGRSWARPKVGLDG